MTVTLMTPCASLVPTTMATDLLVAVVHRAKNAREADREVVLKLARAVLVAAAVAVKVVAEVAVVADAAEVAADRETDREDAAAVALALLLAKNKYVFVYVACIIYMTY